MKTRALLHDPALPGLEGALDAGTIAPVLALMLGEEGSVSGTEILKHKPGSRCAVAYTWEGASGTRRLFAKTFATDRGAAIVSTMDRLHAAASSRDLRLPRPLGYDAPLRLLVTEFLDGIPFATALYEGSSDEPAGRAAKALAALHRAPVPFVRVWSARKEIENTRRWLNQAPLDPALTGAARGLMDRIEARGRGLAQPGSAPGAGGFGPVHRDYYADQLWDCAGRTALLDLDDARSGDAAVDVGNFEAHLTLRAMQFPATAGGCSRARTIFRPAYFAARAGDFDPVAFGERADFYEAATLLRLAAVYAERTRWSAGLPARLLEACATANDAAPGGGRLTSPGTSGQDDSIGRVS